MDADGRRFAFSLVAIAAAALVVRVLYVVVVGPHAPVGADGIWYELQAGTLANGGGYVDPERYYAFEGAFPTANFPPSWPTLLALPEWLGVGSERAFRLVGGGLGAATVVLTGVLGRRIAGWRTGLVAAAIVAASPYLIASDGSLMSDSLYTLLVTASVLSALGIVARPSLWRWSGLGVLLGMGLLTRSDAIVLAPILLAVTAWRATTVPAPRRAVGAVVALGVAVAVVVPWSVRNSVRLGEPILVSSNSANLLEGSNCDQAYGGERIGMWDPACLVETRRPGVPEVEWARAGRAAGIEYAREHAVRLVAVVAPVRVLRGWGLWNPVAQAEIEAVESRNEAWQVAGWAYSLATLALAVPGTVLLLRRRVELAPLLAVIGAVTIVIATSGGYSRYRLAAEPLLAVLAAAALVVWWQGRRSAAPTPDGVGRRG